MHSCIKMHGMALFSRNACICMQNSEISTLCYFHSQTEITAFEAYKNVKRAWSCMRSMHRQAITYFSNEMTR